MKRMVKIASLSIVIGFFVLFFGIDGAYLNAQQDAADQSQQERRREGLVVEWLDNMQNSEDWRAVGTSVSGITTTRKVPGRPRVLNADGQLEEGVSEITDENGIVHGNDYVLGVKTNFQDRGFDRVEVFPPNEISIRGNGKEIKIWVLGRKTRHTLHVKLRDHTGRTHNLNMGRLDFWGWRELSVIIPPYIPQPPRQAALGRHLRIVSFFVQSDPFEGSGVFYFYMSQLRVVIDFSIFTGDDTIKDIW